jgi:hypothetical protein
VMNCMICIFGAVEFYCICHEYGVTCLLLSIVEFGQDLGHGENGLAVLISKATRKLFCSGSVSSEPFRLQHLIQFKLEHLVQFKLEHLIQF